MGEGREIMMRYSARWLSVCSVCCGRLVCMAASLPARAERVTVSLDGEWQIEESVGATEMPKVFEHTVMVPRLANQPRKRCQEPFPNVVGRCQGRKARQVRFSSPRMRCESG